MASKSKKRKKNRQINEYLNSFDVHMVEITDLETGEKSQDRLVEVREFDNVPYEISF